MKSGPKADLSHHTPLGDHDGRFLTPLARHHSATGLWLAALCPFFGALAVILFL
jgi:hypothetical protein